VRVLAEQLIPAVRAAIEVEVEREVANAFDYAEQSPFPDPWELMTDIFKEESNASTPCLS
jgi:TPP-dependent pyruvate/acetoin dehydrogenase alpha subunit